MGPIRHYWILFKLALTAIATGVLLLKMQPIGHLAEAAAQANFVGTELIGLRTSLTVHAAGGLVVLLAALVLAIYKSAAMTREGAPPWATRFGLVLAGLVVLVAVMALFGAHGPGAH